MDKDLFERDVILDKLIITLFIFRLQMIMKCGSLHPNICVSISDVIVFMLV